MRKNQRIRLKPSAATAAELGRHRIAKLASEKRLLDLRFERERGRLVETETVFKYCEGLFVALRAKILASGLSREEQDEILNGLGRLTIQDVFQAADAGAEKPEEQEHGEPNSDEYRIKTD